MGAIADQSDLVNRGTGGNDGTPESIPLFKDGRIGASAAQAMVTGRWSSLWEYNGLPSGGAQPSTVAVPDNTTAGGFLQTDPGGGRTKWSLGGVIGSTRPGTLIIYDRLLHIGDFSGTNTGAQNVGGTLTRYTNGIGVEIWVEIYSAIGGTGTTITASYTDDAGNSGQTSIATPIGGTGLQEAQRMIQLPLASGDRGAQACASVTLAATTGTAGDFGVTLMRRLYEIPMQSVTVATPFGGLLKDLAVEVPTDACLAMAFLPTGTVVPQFWGNISFIEA